MSRYCPMQKRHIFKLLWTEFGQALDLYVQSLSKRSWTWHRFDRALTRLGQQWDRPSTRPFLGQTIDIALTLFGQRLDFLSSPCPTIQRKLVPKTVSMLNLFIPVCTYWVSSYHIEWGRLAWGVALCLCQEGGDEKSGFSNKKTSPFSRLHVVQNIC